MKYLHILEVEIAVWQFDSVLTLSIETNTFLIIRRILVLTLSLSLSLSLLIKSI